MSEDINIQNINGICRLCLKDDGTIIPIFGRENVNRDCIPLSRKILACVSVEVLDKDSLPKMICVGCVHQIDSWHGFKTICDKSQERLNTWLDKQCSRSNSTPLSDVIMGDCIDPITEIVVLDSEEEEEEEEEEMEVESDEDTIDENMESLKEQITIDEISLIEEDSENCERPSDEYRKEFVPSDNLKISGTCSLSDKNVTENSDILHSVGLVQIQTNVETNDNSSRETNDNNSRETNDNNSRETNFELTKCVGTCKSEISKVQSNISELESCTLNRITESDKMCIENGLDSSVNIRTEKTLKVISDLNAESNDAELSETELINSVLRSLIKAVEKEIDGEQIAETNCNVNDKEYCKKHDSLDSGKESTPDTDSTSNNTKFVIHTVTSLAEHQVTNSTADSTWQEVNQGEKQSATIDPEQDSQCEKQPETLCEPDLIVVNSRFITNNGPDTYISGFHIKDEPLSEDEEVVVEEDPLSFSLLNIKKEPTDSADSIPDVKPNVCKLNASLESGRYNPQTRKSGKVYCEPCRSTFPNIYKYSRHAESNRHQLNIELFHTGGDPIMAKKRNKFLGLTSPYKLKKQILNITSYAPRDSGLFKCSQCFSTFTLKRNFIHHMKLKHYDHYVTGVKEANINDVDKALFSFSCTKCNNKFPSNKILKLHTALKHRDLESVCTKCNQEFPRRNALLSHMRFCGLKSSEHTCTTCSGIFTTTALFLAHKQNCRRERLVENHQEKQLACTLCTQLFESTDALITHVQSKHSVQKKQNEETLVIENKPRPMYEFKPKPVLENKFKPVYENKGPVTEQNKKQTFSEEILYCKYCTRTFSNHGALSSHLGYHTRKESFECKLCPTITKTMKAFKQHMRKHLSERTECFMCWICYTPFISAEKLRRHKAVHIKLKIFTCNRCDNSYNSLIALTKHKKKVHGVTDLPVEEEQVLFKQSPQPEEVFEDTIVNDLSENPECKICNKRFSTIGNLKRHSILHLKIKKPIYPPTSSVFSAAGHYRCTNCSRMCGSSAGLKTHYKYCIQRGKGPLGLKPRSLKPRQSVRCDKCKQIFASKACLYKHRYLKRCPLVDRTKTSAFSCINCQKLFTTLPSLQRHLTHCNDGTEKDTSCQYCGLKFSSLIVLSGHLQQCGQNVENNCCTICNENFTSAEELEIHVQTCTPERVPSPTVRGAVSTCTVCNKSFRYSKSMESHIFKNHPETLVDCPTCTQKFVSQIALNDHQIVCTEVQNSGDVEATIQNVQNSQDSRLSHTLCYKCSNCNNVFNSLDDLEIHGVSCGAACESDSSKDTDMKVRIGYNCRNCGKRFTSRSSLYRHKIAKHTEVKSQTPNEMQSQQIVEEPHQPYVCKACPDIVFHKQKGFLEHMAWHNNEEKIRKETPKSTRDITQPMLTCELCDEQFANESLYQDHMEEHINNDVESGSIETPMPTSSTLVHCDICNKGFGNKSSLKSHRACHFRVKYSPTSLANKEFGDASMKKYKVKHVRCNVCYKLLSKNSIAKHKLIHLREDSFESNRNVDQTCITPSFISQDDSILSNSIEDDTSPTTLSESHTVFPCTICNKLFRLRKSLHEHMKMHEENEFDMELKTEDFDDGASTSSFYECKYCDLTWNHKNNYIRHLSTRRHRELQEQLAGII